MKNSYPRYIDSRPIGEDQFEGKSQERIAKSISDHIKSKNNLRILGIEGEWGSGKSNIIELIKLYLQDSHHIYIYDSWGHQEDSHRRAFLEELTENLIESEVLVKETSYEDLSGKQENITWQKKIKYLLSRKRETNKKTIPKISFGIVMIGLVIILSPIFTLISEIIFNENTIWWKKLILPLTPIIVAIFTYFICSIKKKKLINLSEIFYLYKGKELENITYEVFSDIEPSVKEFKDWIQSISDGLKKGLVIVFDNMDRMPPEKVKGLWSSIHTFFAEHKYEQIHIIIPFDRSHLQQAFSQEEIMTNEFINKTFSITYRVSPHVLTDWKDFFTKKFEEAFGENEEDFSTVLSVFDRLKQKFTPRDIIIFINELVTYRAIWEDKIPLRYIAIFVIKKEKILDNPQQVILNSDFLDHAKNLFIEDDKLQNFISALAFNVPIEKASQVLLVRDLELVLRGTSQLTINELAKHNHFIEILEAVVFNSDIEVESAIKVLAELEAQKIKGKSIKYRVIKVWDELSAKQCTIDITTLTFDQNYKSLLINSSQGSQQKLIKYLIDKYINFKNLNGEEYFNCLKALDQFIIKQLIKLKLNSYLIEHKVAPAIFIDYLKAAKSEFKKYKLTTDPSDLDNYLSEKIPNEIDTISDDTNFSYLEEDFSFDKTKEKIESLISENKLTAENFYKILDIYKSISKKKPVDQIISVINLYQLLQIVGAETKGFYDLIAIRLKYANSYNQQIQPKGGMDNTTPFIQSTDKEVVKEIASQIEYYENYGVLLLLSTTWNQPLLNSVCKELTLDSYGRSRLNILEILPVFNNIISSIEVPEQDLLKRLDSWYKYTVEKINTENLKEIIPDYTFFKHTTSYSFKIAEHINRVAVEYLNSVDEQALVAEWYNDDSYIYNSLYIFMNNNIKALPRNVFNSLKQILKNISESKTVIPEDETIWSFFINKTKKNDIAPTIRGIRDYFILNGNITSELFIFFAEFFNKFGKLSDKPGDVTRTILGKVISNNDCFYIILTNKEHYMPLINNANEDAADLKDNIYERLKDYSEDEKIASFAKSIGVELQAENNEDE